MSIDTITVSSVMTRDVKTAKESQTVKTVAKIMTDKEIGSVVILRNDDTANPVGIITARDIVRMAGATQVLTLQMPAREIMSKPLVTIEPTASLNDAIQTMELKNIRRLPVVDREKKMIGIVTGKDIFRAIMKSQQLVASFGETISIEYKPVYERLSEFMLGEMLLPGSHDGNV